MVGFLLRFQPVGLQAGGESVQLGEVSLRFTLTSDLCPPTSGFCFWILVRRAFKIQNPVFLICGITGF